MKHVELAQWSGTNADGHYRIAMTMRSQASRHRRAGLGDIAVPGLLAGLALRYDASRAVDMNGRAQAAGAAMHRALGLLKVLLNNLVSGQRCIAQNLPVMVV